MNAPEGSLSGHQTPGLSPHSAASPDRSVTARASTPAHRGRSGPLHAQRGGRRDSSRSPRAPPPAPLTESSWLGDVLPSVPEKAVRSHSQVQSIMNILYKKKKIPENEGPGLGDGMRPDAGTWPEWDREDVKGRILAGHPVWGLGASGLLLSLLGPGSGCSRRGRPSPGGCRTDPLILGDQDPPTPISAESVWFLQCPTCTHIGLFDAVLLAS